MIQIPGSSVLPKVASILSQKEKVYSPRYKKQMMTQEEYQHMQQVSRNLATVGSIKKKQSPYYLTNAKLKKVHQLKQKGPEKVQMRSRFLENYFVMNRNELEVRVTSH